MYRGTHTLNTVSSNGGEKIVNLPDCRSGSALAGTQRGDMAETIEFHKTVEDFFGSIHGRRLLIQTHDVPDPDALASAEALMVAARRYGIQARIYANGFPQRRENVVFMKVCHITLYPLESLDIHHPSRYAWAFIDCLPGGGNVTMHREAPGDVFLAIDHHVTMDTSVRFSGKGYYISYPTMGSTATVLARIMFGLDIPLSPRLAAALSYAIITDTQDFSRGWSAEDLEVYSALFPTSNQRIISRLRNVSKPRSYFRKVHRSLADTRFYRHAAWVYVGGVENGEMVAEMADFILTCERITWSLALGYASGRLYLSLRSVSGKARCGHIIRRMTARYNGAAGGHNQFAGGFVNLDPGSKPEAVAMDIVERFLRILYRIPKSADVPHGTPLVQSESADRRVKAFTGSGS